MTKPICKICMKDIEDKSLHFLLCKNNHICDSCFAKFVPRFINFKIDNINALAIYEYDQEIKELLFKFKGCYDYELKDAFLSRYLPYLRLRYHNFVIIPLPSYHLDDKKRGFNHIESIVSGLNLPIYKILYKTEKVKQSHLSQKERLLIKKYLQIKDESSIHGKKVLVVDDIYTTGSSMRAAIDLIKKGHPKKIEVLVIAKNLGNGPKS